MGKWTDVAVLLAVLAVLLLVALLEGCEESRDEYVEAQAEVLLQRAELQAQACEKTLRAVQADAAECRGALGEYLVGD